MRKERIGGVVPGLGERLHRRHRRRLPPADRQKRRALRSRGEQAPGENRKGAACRPRRDGAVLERVARDRGGADSCKPSEAPETAQETDGCATPPPVHHLRRVCTRSRELPSLEQPRAKERHARERPVVRQTRRRHEHAQRRNGEDAERTDEPAAGAVAEPPTAQSPYHERCRHRYARVSAGGRLAHGTARGGGRRRSAHGEECAAPRVRSVYCGAGVIA
mmetsp:Transcript_1405/g.5194  ORF Transcript_1405/g.5194 Transcript_1405/m.5194 type:complete len:220 (-) Transcript_1405:54-713(-)